VSTPVQEPPSSEPIAPAPRGRSLWRSLAALGALVLFKGKALLGLLKLASLSKFALTGFSMLAMIAFEAQRGGWLFGVGFVVLIFLHEMGHAYAIRREGLQAGWPVFIPFFGAMITMQGRPQSRAAEARIAYGGPLAGTLASLLTAAVYLLTGSRIWLGLAHTGFFLNLFNLVPMSPLDGGRVAQAFSRRASWIGGLLLGGLFLVTMAPQLLLIAGLAVAHNFQRRRENEPTDEPRHVQTSWALRYFGLCAFLGAALYFTSTLLGEPAR